MRVLKHRDTSGNVLYNFPQVASLSGEKDRVVFLSQRDMSIIYSAIEFADRIQTRVFESVEHEHYVIVADEDFRDFGDFIQSIRLSLGDWPVSNQYLERIAIALESLDSKTAAFVTWDEMLEDLENALGVGHLLTQAVSTFLDLFPSLRIKVDATDMLGKVWEYYTFRLPILTLLGTIASALTISAASSVAQKGIDIYRAVLATLDTASFVANGWREFIFGSWSVYGDFLKPLLDRFFADSDGGDGGIDPDNDPQLRPLVNLANNVRAVANATITCNQCGGAAGACGHIGNGPIIDPAENPGQPDLETPPASWGGSMPAFSQYKCNAATLLADSYIAYVERYRSLSGIIETLGAFGLFTGLSGVFPTLLSVLYTTVLWAYLVTVSALGLPLLALLATYKTNLEDSKDQLICDLLEALDPAAARSVIEAWIDDNLPVELPSSWTSVHITNLFPSTVLNILFEEYGPALDYESNCDACDPCALGWNVIEGVNTGSGDLSFGGPRTLSSVENPNGFHYIEFGIPGECCPAQVYVTIHSYSTRTGDEGGLIRTCDNTDLWHYSSGALPLSSFCAQLFGLGACTSAWTVSVSISEDCP